MAKPAKRETGEAEVVGFLGIGLDSQDGHRRVTTGENFVLLGGSSETHERMIDTASQVNQALRRKGKTLAETSPDEVVDLFREARESQG